MLQLQLYVLITTVVTVVIIRVMSQTLPVIQTKLGSIRGRLVSGQTPSGEYRDIYEFTSIRYAEPPVGPLRFKTPVPVHPWNASGVFDATETPNSCIQDRGIFGDGLPYSEDCLIINLWVPRVHLDGYLNGNTSKALSVYMFIHGGGFHGGTSVQSYYNGSCLAATNNIIVSNVHYRVGPLGFAYLGTDDVPGNMGLFDQMEAMKWLSQNIAGFGGNGSSITIGGESAGAMSVSTHLITRDSRNYFQKAIVESGIAGTWDPASAKQTTEGFFNQLCPQNFNSSAERIKCLRSLSTDNFEGVRGYWPVHDGSYIPLSEWEAFSTGQFYKAPLLVGANSGEGSLCSHFNIAKSVATAVSNVYAYNFAHVAGSQGSINRRVYHTEEMAFVFGVPFQPEQYFPGMDAFDESDQAVSGAVMTFWGNFVKFSDPNGPNRLRKWLCFNERPCRQFILTIKASNVLAEYNATCETISCGN